MGRPVVGSCFCSIAIDQRVFFSEMSPAPLRVYTASAAVARLLSYGAPRRSDLTIINDAIKVTTLICSRYTPRVKQVGGRRESLGRRYEAINHPGRGAETILINRYIVAVAADFLYFFLFNFCEWKQKLLIEPFNRPIDTPEVNAFVKINDNIIHVNVFI